MFRYALAFSLLPFAALAQERIMLPEGATHTVVQAAEGTTYVLDAAKGQVLNLTISGGVFAIVPPGETVPSYRGTTFSGMLPETGDYTVVVDSRVPFALDVAITNDAPTGAPVLAP